MFRLFSQLPALLAALILAACTALPVAPPGMPEVFVQALQQAGIDPAAVALQVQVVDHEQARFAHNAARSFQPASIMKLVTTQAALELLGPDYRWTTRFYIDGVQEGDVLHGDLIVRGGGDPRFAQEDLWRALRRIRAMGLREIRGALVLDRSLFQPMEQDSGLFDGEPARPYNAVPDALLFNGKTLSLRFIPDLINQRVRVGSEPPLADFDIVSPALGSGDCGDWTKRLGMVQALRGERGVRFGGAYAASCGERSLAVHLHTLSHAEYAEAALRQIWIELGGTLAGAMREGPVPATAREILQWQSMPLASVLTDMNKFSSNVIARQLLLSFALLPTPQPPLVSTEAGAARMHAWLQAKGVTTATLVLENGSGLSRSERLSAAAMAQVLQLAWHSPTMPEFIASLPIAGTDGTMSRRVQWLSVRGHAHIKTGSLQGVASIAGYVHARSGRRVIVVCMVNHVNAAAARAAFDPLLQWVYDHG